MESKIPASCPYSKQNKNNSGMMSNSYLKEEVVNTTFDTEKGLEMSNMMSTLMSSNRQEIEKCPYKMNQTKPEPVPYTEVRAKIKDDEKVSDDEDELQQGGCPVINRIKKDPPNKHYEAHYEVPKFGAYDFMFLMRGALETDDYLEKTKNIRSYPRHLKYTLFYQHQDNLKKVHEKEFPVVFFAYDDIKEKGNRLFRRKKFKEAVEHYTYAYGFLNWIEFKDKKRQAELRKKPSLDPILDEDIEKKMVYIDDPSVEDDSYKACVVYVLMNLAAAYMELRHYSEAVDCLDECIEIAMDKVPDLYFRRSQARTYNKYSTKEQLEKARQDIEKAIQLKEEEPMYKEHKAILEKTVQQIKDTEKERAEKIMNKAKKSYQKIKDKHLNIDEVIYTKKDKDAIQQYKILKEMKNKYALAIKFFTESKNEEQLALCYDEMDKFMETYDEFKFYFKFDNENIPSGVAENLTEEEKALLNDETMIKLTDEFKYKICEDVFGGGDFNFELFQYSMERVFEEERKAEEEAEKEKALTMPKQSWFQSISKSGFVKFLSGGIVLLSIGSLGAHYYLYSSNASGLFK
jgi:tetratricopeptide (TPR) repeat protein